MLLKKTLNLMNIFCGDLKSVLKHKINSEMCPINDQVIISDGKCIGTAQAYPGLPKSRYKFPKHVTIHIACF